MGRLLSDREESFLKFLQAKPTINSGATQSDADGVAHYSLRDYDKIGIEIKCTDNKSFSLKKETWDKMKKIGFQQNEMPLMGIDIQGTRLIVLDANDFMSMIDLIETLFDNAGG